MRKKHATKLQRPTLVIRQENKWIKKINKDRKDSSEKVKTKSKQNKKIRVFVLKMKHKADTKEESFY